jgi:hypothetical protein
MEFTEDAGGLLLPTKGRVTVDLIDADSGRVVQREESDNFLSAQSLKVARWWQRIMWGMYNPIYTPDAVGNRPHEMPWFPAHHLAYWNDASAEDPTNEDRITKELVGWASRHPVGSPSGKRGVVNVSESAVTDAAAKWVFDWTTSQGNGTFQSVGWTRLHETTGFPIARVPDDDMVSFTSGGAGTPNMGNPLYWDGSANLWYLGEYTNTGNAFRLASAPAVGGATTAVCTIPTAIANSNYLLSIGGRIGTDFIVTAYTSNLFRLARITAAGAQVWNANPSSLATWPYDSTVDGSGNIWTCDSGGVVRRHSNADGSITATVNPTMAPSELLGITYDAADGNFWVIGTVAGIGRQMWKMDSSGNTVGPLYSLKDTRQTVVSSTPYAGQYFVSGAAARDAWLLRWNSSNTFSSEPGNDFSVAPVRDMTVTGAATTINAPLTVKDALPWLAGRITSAGTTRATPIRGGTLGTRSKLTSAVTKTSSQALKVTYQFNFS